MINMQGLTKNKLTQHLGTDNGLNINTSHQGILPSDLYPNDRHLKISSSSSLQQSNSVMPGDAGHTLNNAQHLNVGSTLSNYSDSISKRHPNNYYAFDVNGNSQLNLSLQSKHAALDVQVLNSKGEVIKTSTSTNNTDSISINLDTGTYYVKVYPEKAKSNVKYELDLSATPIANQLSTTGVLSSASNLTTNPVAAVKDPLIGTYYGNQGWNMNQVQALESWQGKKDAVVNMFTNWSNDSTTINNLFNSQLPNIWNNKNVPMITWEPFTGSTTSSTIDKDIASGMYDSYISNWADKLKTFLTGTDSTYNTGDDRRAYIRLGHEMNGNWYPWGASATGNSPTDYVNMWRHVESIFTSKGMDSSHVQWVWSVNNTDSNSNYKAEAFYPGDAYVNWVAIDGYNWGTSQSWSSWQTPDQVFGNMVGRLQTLTSKPIAFTEAGSSTATSSGTSVAAKAQWMTDLYNYAVNKNVKMVSWFNQDKETDWASFGGANGDSTFSYNGTSYNTYQAYKTAISSPSYSGTDTTNARLLDDTHFSGLMS